MEVLLVGGVVIAIALAVVGCVLAPREYDPMYCRYCGNKAVPKVEMWTTVTIVSNDCPHCGYRDVRVF